MKRSQTYTSSYPEGIAKILAVTYDDPQKLRKSDRSKPRSIKPRIDSEMYLKKLSQVMSLQSSATSDPNSFVVMGGKSSKIPVQMKCFVKKIKIFSSPSGLNIKIQKKPVAVQERDKEVAPKVVPPPKIPNHTKINVEKKVPDQPKIKEQPMQKEEIEIVKKVSSVKRKKNSRCQSWILPCTGSRKSKSALQVKKDAPSKTLSESTIIDQRKIIEESHVKETKKTLNVTSEDKPQRSPSCVSCTGSKKKLPTVQEKKEISSKSVSQSTAIDQTKINKDAHIKETRKTLNVTTGDKPHRSPSCISCTGSKKKVSPVQEKISKEVLPNVEIIQPVKSPIRGQPQIKSQHVIEEDLETSVQTKQIKKTVLVKEEASMANKKRPRCFGPCTGSRKKTQSTENINKISTEVVTQSAVVDQTKIKNEAKLSDQPKKGKETKIHDQATTSKRNKMTKERSTVVGGEKPRWNSCMAPCSGSRKKTQQPTINDSISSSTDMYVKAVKNTQKEHNLKESGQFQPQEKAKKDGPVVSTINSTIYIVESVNPPDLKCICPEKI